MNPLVVHVATSLAGAARLARFDVGGMALFDISVPGFWRSFWAAGLVAPFFLLLLVLRHIDVGGGGAFIHNILIESLAYVIAWLLFPLVMASVVRMLDCADKYIDFVVAYNWCGAIQNGVYLPIAILGYTGALAPDLANTLALTAILWVVVYTFFVIRTTLQVPPATAFGVVVLDFVIGILLDGFTNRFI